MQFNSFIFIFCFLPIVVVTYFIANKINYLLGKFVIIISSIIFYTYFDRYMFIILGISLLINFIFSRIINIIPKWKKIIIVFPIIVNVGLLLYFKYFNFVIENINHFTHSSFTIRNIIIPLGISFYSFQQIAYIVSVYNHEIDHCSFIDYLTYILYFPKILMGPLTEPIDFISQMNDNSLKKIDWSNIAFGIQAFCFGLFKKVMLADVFAKAVAWGYTNVETSTAIDWFLISLFYTFEIYFDFSGYSDMAVGVSMMLNITLPINFDSPYKAFSIRDFWKRWHISLTKFFTKYIYIPLGGNRKGMFFTCVNTLIVFLISGVWHGANWTFILWGILHGLCMIFDRMFEKMENKVFEPVRWFLTFNVINVLWLLFRSDSISQWKHLILKVLLMQNTTISQGLINSFALPEEIFLTDIFHLDFWVNNLRGFWMIVYLLMAFGICLIPDNNYRHIKKLSVVSMFLSGIVFVWGVICLSSESVFVYFNF